MKVLFFSTKHFERSYIIEANKGFTIEFTDMPLTIQTASLANGFDVVCIFTADDASVQVLQLLMQSGVRFLAVRAAGYDNVDILAANRMGIVVANVPEYSPYAIAEHATCLILALNRKLQLAHKQVHEHDFSLDNLIGFDLHNKKVGIIGTGRVGSVMVKIMHGFGCNILAYDVNRSHILEQQYNVQYTSLKTLCSLSDIISIHVALNSETHHLVNRNVLENMRKGVMLINTARGGVIKTDDLIEFLENGHIGYCGMDVYEKEKGIFFYNHSSKPVNDPWLNKLLGLSNVLLTPHQAFLTDEALYNIAATTFYNLDCWKRKVHSVNELTDDHTSENLSKNDRQNVPNFSRKS